MFDGFFLQTSHDFLHNKRLLGFLLLIPVTRESKLLQTVGSHVVDQLHSPLRPIRGRPFNSWGGGGWFWKKISCKRLSEEKNCTQHKCNGKKYSCAAVRKKKMLQSYFIIPGVFKKSLQNCNHSLPLLTLNSGFDDAAKLLLHMCNALLAYHKQYYKWR